VTARGRALLLAAAVALPATAAAMLTASASPAIHGGRASFQREVGGLGLGPAVDLSRCACGFDPRVESGCALGLEPVPVRSALGLPGE